MTKAVSISINPVKRHVIRFAPGIYKFLTETICRFEPEHYAVLAVRLDDPFYVVEAYVMPPLSGNSSRSHVQLNDQFIEYLLNVVLLHRGLYIGGIVHTHPGGFTHLSGGIEGSGQGDIPSIRAALERAQTFGNAGKSWTNFLAPVITMDAKTWKPTFTGWVVRLDRPEPIPAEIAFEAEDPVSDIPQMTNIDVLMEPATKYQDAINLVLGTATPPQEDSQFVAECLRSIMRADLTARRNAIIDKIV